MKRDDFLAKRLPPNAKLIAWFLLERGGVTLSPKELSESLGLTLGEVQNAAGTLRRHGLNVSRQTHLIVLPDDRELIEDMREARVGRKAKSDVLVEQLREQLAETEQAATVLQMRIDRLETIEQTAAAQTAELARLRFKLAEMGVGAA